jgi:PqqD family protein of HPr-rel-A system
MKWRACSQGKTYDTGNSHVVYFDSASGSTYMISEVAAWLLSELAASPLTKKELINRFMSRAEDISGDEAMTLVEAQISELQSYDLIEAS